MRVRSEMKPIEMDDKGAAVMLPCGQDEFGDFIRSLLGKPQSITNRFLGAFDLSRPDLEQFHYLLIDRMAQQNKVQLVMFTARVIYDDGSTVQVNDFEAFKTYNEIKPIVSSAAHLSWEFLVTFEDRKTPEKQQIDISFLTGGEFHFIDRVEGQILHAEIGGTGGTIAYRINHTARTWASDIDALLSTHIKNILPAVSSWRKWISDHSSHLGVCTFLVLFLSSIVTLVRASDSFWIASRDILTQNMAGQNEISQKMQLIAAHVASGAAERFMARCIAFVLGGLIVSIALAIWVGATSTSTKSGFLCLTKKSEEAKAKALRKAQHRFIGFCLSVIVSIACGIVGNYLFALYVRKWQP